MLSLVSASAQSNTTKPVKASFYADAFENRHMAGGGLFHQTAISCASLQYPLGTTLKLTSLKTSLSVTVVVTDRGPWTKRYQLDLSKAAFKALGLDQKAGWGWVTVQVVSPENFPEETPDI